MFVYVCVCEIVIVSLICELLRTLHLFKLSTSIKKNREIKAGSSAVPGDKLSLSTSKGFLIEHASIQLPVLPSSPSWDY